MRLVYAITFLLMLVAQLAVGAPICEGIAQFDPPAGWNRQVVNGTVMFTFADRGIFTVQPSELCGSIDKNVDKFVTRLSASPEFRIEAQRTHGQHIASGGQWATFAYSAADPNRPGQYKYGWISLVAAGGRSVAIVAVFSEAQSFNAHVKELGHMIDTMRITSGMVLERGKPPLTRFDVDASIEFIEWLMQVPLNDGQKQFVETEMRKSWRENKRDDIDGVRKILDTRDQLAVLPSDQREFARQKILDDAMKQWRNDPAPDARMMVEIYDCSHKAIAPGNPPLTQQSVDALVECLCFAAGQTVGVSCTPSADIKARLAQQVSTNYSSMTPDQQQKIAAMPLQWAALRVAWPAYSDAERQQYVNAWQRDESIVKLASILKGAPTTAASADGSTGNSTQQAVVTMQKIQNQQMVYQTLSNCMRMQYETNRAIIANMGGGYHYEYRWR